MKDKKSKGTSAGDLMRQLESDPSYQARQRNRAAARREIEQTDQLEETPLVADLNRIGLDVSSVWDLVNSSEPYRGAIPVLVEHLRRDYNDRVKEGIARALTVKEASGSAAVKALIEEFRALEDRSTLGAKWAVANALTVVADAQVAESIVELALDANHGEARRPLLALLSEFGTTRARSALQELLQDPELAGEARAALDRMTRD